MANKDIIVSTEQGTILNYFGVANTYDPFTNQSKLQKIEDLNFNIPELPPFDLAEFVAVSTGLLATSLSFLNYCEFSILDKNTGAKITDLKNNIGEIGNTSFYPSENQIFWFNRDGLRGTFYLNKAHAGRVLHITSGMFSTTSITSGVLNDMFARTTGVPKYIEDINASLLDTQSMYVDSGYWFSFSELSSVVGINFRFQGSLRLYGYKTFTLTSQSNLGIISQTTLTGGGIRHEYEGGGSSTGGTWYDSYISKEYDLSNYKHIGIVNKAVSFYCNKPATVMALGYRKRL